MPAFLLKRAAVRGVRKGGAGGVRAVRAPGGFRRAPYCGRRAVTIPGWFREFVHPKMLSSP